MTNSAETPQPSKAGSVARILAVLALAFLVVGIALVSILDGGITVTILRLTVYVPGGLALGALVLGLLDASSPRGRRTLLIAAVVLAVCAVLMGYGSLTSIETTLPT